MIAGLVVGILLIAVFAIVFKPAFAMTDDELIAETRKLAEVEYFLTTYPDAAITIDRAINAKWVMVTYAVQGQRCDPADSLEECIKTLRLNIELGSMIDTRSALVCSGLITWSNSDDIIKSIETDGCFTPVSQFAPPTERVLIE